MITTTLNRIRECDPFDEGWKKLLKSLGKTKADDDPLTFRQIVKSNGVEYAIWALRSLEDQMPAKLLTVAFAQRIEHLMQDDSSKNALKISHLHLHGEATTEELLEAKDADRAAYPDAYPPNYVYVAYADAAYAYIDADYVYVAYNDDDAYASAAAYVAYNAAADAYNAAADAYNAAADAAGYGAAYDAERKAQEEWLIAITDSYE